MAQGGPLAVVATNVRCLAAELDRSRVSKRDAGDRLIPALKAGGAVAVVLLILTIVLIDGDVRTHLLAAGQARAFFHFITPFGQSEWFLVPAGLIGLTALLVDKRRIGRKVAAAWAELGQLAGFAFVSIAGSGLIAVLLKCVIGRVRPKHAMGILSFNPVAFDYSNLSFPSGHAATVAAAFVVFALILRRWPVLVGLLACIAILIAGSRIALGVHYPSDVLAGALVGTTFSLLCARSLARRRVAFRQCPDGRLVPKTIALRALIRR